MVDPKRYPKGYLSDSEVELLPRLECSPLPAPILVDEGLEQLPLFTAGATRITSSGSVTLYKPNEAMRVVHDRAQEMFRFSFNLGVWGGYTRNACLLAWGNCPYIYEIDLLDAFGSVHPERVARYFLRSETHSFEYTLGENEEEVCAVLKKYFFHEGGGLIQGAPASPRIFELACNELDQRLRELCYEWGGSRLPPPVFCSRYADNLVFGSRSQPLTEEQKRAIRQLIREAGFTINPRKTRSIVLRKQSVVICGVGLRKTRKGVKVFMPRPLLGRLEGMLHLATTGRPVDVNQLHGLMGVFRQTTNPYRMNATERRVYEAYARLYPVKDRRRSGFLYC